MRNRIRLCVVSFALVILGSIAFSRAEAATAEETLAKINRLPPAERQAALVKEAKNEKTVIWYAPMNREDLRQFTSGFEAEYPFLKVEILTGGPQSLLNRILTEHRAGKDYFDILNIRSSALYTPSKKLAPSGATTRPAAAACARAFTTKTDTSTASGRRSWFTCSTPNRSAAHRRPNPSTICCKPSGKEKWAWIRTPTISSPRCSIITATSKANRSRRASERSS